jgi:hypothetical protein
VFYVEHFVKVDAEICGSALSQNGKLLSADGFAAIGDGYFRMWMESTKVDLTESCVVPRKVQFDEGLEKMGVMFPV